MKGILLAGLILIATDAQAQFNLGTSIEDLRRTTGTYAVSDLAVGEVGILGSLHVCHEDNSLLLNARTELTDSTYEYTTVTRARRETGGQFSIELTKGESSTVEPVDTLVSAVLRSFPCAFYRNAGMEFVEIHSINGETDLLALLGR